MLSIRFGDLATKLINFAHKFLSLNDFLPSNKILMFFVLGCDEGPFPFETYVTRISAYWFRLARDDVREKVEWNFSR